VIGVNKQIAEKSDFTGKKLVSQREKTRVADTRFQNSKFMFAEENEKGTIPRSHPSAPPSWPSSVASPAASTRAKR
jgi:hypothetical protein